MICRRSGNPHFFSLLSVFSLFVLFTSILLAGCIEPGYQPDHDVLVIKLSSNGSLEWSKVIDKGGDDKAGIVIPTNDGGSIISTNFDNYLRFSKDGNILWEKEFRDPLCMGDALIQLRDGSFVTASSGNGVVCKLDKNGNLLWNKSSVKFDSVMTSSIHSVIETNDGGFLVAGNYLTRLDPDGRPIWQYSYATHDGIQGYEKTFSVIEMKNRGFLGLSQKYDHLYVIRLDPNGTIIANSSLGEFSSYHSQGIKENNNGYSIMVDNKSNSTMDIVHLDADGNIVNQRTLKNSPAIVTSDGGYFSVIVQNPDEKPDNLSEKGKIAVGGKKLDADGTEMWRSTPLTFCKPVKTTINIGVSNVVQTSDGGYIILGSRDNFWKC